jgi:hypothetical protein
MCVLSDFAAYLLEMFLHGIRIGIGHHQSRAFVALGANGAKDIGVFIALVGGLTRPGPFHRPLIGLTVFLADARFILKPDFNAFTRRQVFQACLQGLSEVFLKTSITFWSCFGCCGRALEHVAPKRIHMRVATCITVVALCAASHSHD